MTELDRALEVIKNLKPHTALGPTQEAKTIRARIKIAVWPDGSWTAYGDHTKSAERTMNDFVDSAPGGESWHWIEADVPLPATIEGKIVP